MKENRKGKVWLAGAGPGDVGLLTVRTKEMLERADVIVYDALVSAEILCQIPSEKEIIYVGKRSGNHSVPQEEINKILLLEAEKGKRVLRLKGGDPFVFGRGGEELELLAEHRIPFEVIPGVTSAAAVPAYAGIPVTHRDYTSSFHVITGHLRKDGTSEMDYPSLVKLNGTLVFLMGISSMRQICEGLVRAGMRTDMPAAVLERGTTAAQRRVVSDISHLPEAADKAGIGTPAIILVGEVCALANAFAWAEKRPLGGRQFLITRPRQNSSVLAEKLRNLGAQVLELPTIRTEGIVPNPQLEEALNTVGNVAGCSENWLVFTSPIGVQMFFEQMRNRNIDIRTLLCRGTAVKLAVIGSATGKALRQYGLFPDLMPEVYDAKSLGQLLAQQAEPDSRILIVRAKQGSEELIPPLCEAGLIVKDVPLYETVHELHRPIREQIRAEIERGAVDAIVFTSGSTVRGFGESMKTIPAVPTVCIGSRTAAEAQKYGMQVQIAKQASVSSLVELIVERYGRGTEC